MAVIESKGDGFSLFNGVKLLSLPEYDKEKYPYAVLARADAFSCYTLIVSEVPYTYRGTKFGLGCDSYHYRSSWDKLDGSAVWEIVENNVYILGNMGSNFVPVWSNYDIISTSDNSVYLAASEPISLDGMNVIEWDGDTTGLVKRGSNKYCVSTTLDADVTKDYAYIVVNQGTPSAVEGTPLEQSGYYAFGSNIDYAPEETETHSVAGWYFQKLSTIRQVALLAYYPIAEPEQPELPDGYTKLAYLESTGSQYINTGIIPGSKTISAEVKFKLDNVSSKDTGGVIGSVQKDGENNIQFTVFKAQWRTKINDFASYNGEWDANEHTLKLNTSTGTYLDEVQITDEQFTIAAGNTYPMFLGAACYYGSPIDAANNPYLLIGRLYYCKIWDGDTIIRDFIPVLDSNGVPGMYDKVSGVFYGNAGTGEFVYPEVGTDISAGIKFLIRQIFNGPFAEQLIKQMRE